MLHYNEKKKEVITEFIEENPKTHGLKFLLAICTYRNVYWYTLNLTPKLNINYIDNDFLCKLRENRNPRIWKLCFG